LPPNTDTHDLPRLAGDFELLRELGRGGMGVVFEARHLPTDRTVALKLLSPDLEYSDEAYQRFEREARLAASISHPRCVFVLGAHKVDGSPAISMELMTGESLQDRLDEQGALPVDLALTYTRQLLDGMQAAQRAGVVHRDIKPANCFFAPDGQLKIGDFGLSRSLVTDTRITVAGQFLGSPLYASPEQVRGEPVDVRSDVYSLGATLYHMLAGRPPFAGKALVQVVSSILTEDPPALEGVPRELGQIVQRAMHKQPDERFEDHRAFDETLATFQAAGTLTAPAGKRRIAGLADVALNFGILVWSADAIEEWLAGSGDGSLRGLFPAIMLSLVFKEAWDGRTLGHKSLGLRLVARSSGRHEPRRALARTGLSFLLTAIIAGPVLVEAWRAPWVAAGISLTGLALWASTARPGNGWRMLHDVLAGTEVVKAGDPRLEPTSAPPDPPRVPREDAPARLGAYEVAGPLGESTAGRWWSGRDPRLQRRVWLHVAKGDEAPARPPPVADRSLQLADQFAGESGWVDVYECPGGISFADLRADVEPLPWPRVQSLVQQVAEVLEAAPSLDAGRLWVDDGGRVRVLDHGLVGCRSRSEKPLDTLATLTRGLLAGDGSEAQALPGWPWHAEEWLARLLGRSERFASLSEAAAALAALDDREAEVTPAMRQKAMWVSGAVWVLTAGGGATPVIRLFDKADRSGWPAIATSVLLPVAVSAGLCFWLRGGIGMATADIGLRDGAGRRVSRGRAAWRAVMTWLPWLALLSLTYEVSTWFGLQGWGALRPVAGVAVLLFLIVPALVLSGRFSIQDRLANTHLVPR
jgi:uncharacterized RDD family membrane protein YckC